MKVEEDFGFGWGKGERKWRTTDVVTDSTEHEKGEFWNKKVSCASSGVGEEPAAKKV